MASNDSSDGVRTNGVNFVTVGTNSLAFGFNMVLASCRLALKSAPVVVFVICAFSLVNEDCGSNCNCSVAGDCF